MLGETIKQSAGSFSRTHGTVLINGVLLNSVTKGEIINKGIFGYIVYIYKQTVKSARELGTKTILLLPKIIQDQRD